MTRKEAIKRLTNRYNEQVERFPVMRDHVSLILYIKRNIAQVRRENLLVTYEHA